MTTLMQTQDIEPDLGDTRDSIVLPPKSPNSQTSLGTGPINGGADVPILAEDVPWYGEQLNRDLKTQPLSKMALRNAYRREATCHEGLLKRTRAAGRAVPPRIHAFRDFLAIVGPAPAWKATIDRRLNDWRDYEPENVRWADKPTQTNNRETTILIQPPNGGQPLTTIQLARRQKVTDGAIRRRRSRGWTDAENTLGKRAPTLTIAPTPEIESDSLDTFGPVPCSMPTQARILFSLAPKGGCSEPSPKIAPTHRRFWPMRSRTGRISLAKRGSITAGIQTGCLIVQTRPSS